MSAGEDVPHHAIDEAIVDALTSGGDAAFVAACRRLVAERPTGAVGALRTALRRPLNSTCRRSGVAAIIRLGEDSLLREVAHALRHDDRVVVIGAARILGEVGDPRAVPNLVEALRTDDVGIGAAVIDALGLLGDPVALPWVVAALDYGFCVESCCRALGHLGDSRAIAPLQQRAGSSQRAIALAATQALVRLEERGVR